MLLYPVGIVQRKQDPVPSAARRLHRLRLALDERGAAAGRVPLSTLNLPPLP